MLVPSSGILVRRAQALLLLRVLLLTVLLTTVLGGQATAAELSASAQQRIRSATFEVVQLKPTADQAVYERPLPLDLIPYQQRVDRYRSIGTAFAIGENRFVTAAHVILVGVGSQFGPPALRDASGQVYDIDQVLEYSQPQDFVEFSLKQVPRSVHPLKTADPPALNSAVFAVGNALGEGIVIRDGVYTSDTPEEEEGRWKWLRFTAAASPGNSGGPLVDDSGRVVGVVLRKSPSENLNYAAPIRLVTGGSEHQGVAGQRTTFRLPFMDVSEIIEEHAQIPLPKPLGDLYAAVQSIRQSFIESGDTAVLSHHQDRLFPNGATSDELLTRVYRSPFPRHIAERQDRLWGAALPNTHRAELEHNGFVQYGDGMFRLRAPDDLALSALYGDSKQFMDLMLRSGYSLYRSVGTDSVKVVSLGRAQEESSYRDKFGRLWQVKVWPIAFDDASLITFNLPTPEGYVSLFLRGPTAVKGLIMRQEQLLADFIWVTYEGTLPRWREYLALRSVQPSAFGNFSLDIDPEFSRVRFDSKRCSLTIGPDEEPLTRDSVLSLNFSFFRDGARVVWEPGGIALGEHTQKNNWLIVQRTSRPAASLPEEIQSAWAKEAAGEFPYNGVAADDNGGMRISMAADLPRANGQVPAADQVKVRYVLRVIAEGAPGQPVMHAKLERLHKAFKALEY